ncbi:bifunctional 3,4-dihydroxy-2-butanone-4-phosphate synthase/GTP cyclohydrolase II [bacterium]|nr:bifunctional 3,4-dihydroxy-2-butanone-4-phosphate synthase/GTP cyclohydrolase II [bacterium]MBU1638514.1 bifunctional 3,4-dihydroxy-2-butanone-4-phosphate synthase/GTP cyclohydrolase II [bacterium]MBU1921082.1 bifunctional 3,4-dihydroxy-2-butanone-4-phosphate synthase/GTP cyclohydrolase II [bacterium]
MLDRIEDALVDISEGKLVIVVDAEDRENEGDLVQASECVTPDSINFMATHGRGMICVSMLNDRADQLQLRPMVPVNSAPLGTAFTESVDYLHGTSTGISCYDRARTVRAIADPGTHPADLGRPGHIHPLRAREGGVFERQGQTEASVDLARLAGLYPSGVLCEIMNDDGTMMRLPDLRKYASKHNLKLISIEDLIVYRTKHEYFMDERVRVGFPTKHGEFTLMHFEDRYKKLDHLAIVKGEIPPAEPLLIRVHSECLTGDVFGSARCDCGNQLDFALDRINDEGAGMVIYLRQEGRGIGLGPKLQAYKLQDHGYDTVEANIELGFKPDLRDYGAAAQILRRMNVNRIRLMTNNPEKVKQLEAFGIKVTERVPIDIPPTEINYHYLQTKRDKMGHWLNIKER